MKLERVKLYNFRSFGEEQTIRFDDLTTLVCKKLFKQQLDVANMPEDVAKAMYEGQAPHDMYIGEIVDIIRKG